MEPNFQTSFIPKKPIVAERARSPRSVGFLTLITLVIFLTMVFAFLGFYFYKISLVKSIASMEQQLNRANSRFEPAKITQLQTLDKRLRGANQVVTNHMVVSPIFKALSEITMKTIRYTSFNYSVEPENNSKIAVKLTGQAVGYRSIALQSDLFLKNKNLVNPVFSNLSLDEKGNVLFDLDFLVDPSFVDYKRALLTTVNQIETQNPSVLLESVDELMN